MENPFCFHRVSNFTFYIHASQEELFEITGARSYTGPIKGVRGFIPNCIPYTLRSKGVWVNASAPLIGRG